MTVNYAVQKLKVHKILIIIIIIMITTIIIMHTLVAIIIILVTKNPGDVDTAAGCIIAALQQLLAQYSFTRTPSVY